LGEYEYGFNGIALNISDSQAQKLLDESPFVEAVYKNLEVEMLLADAVPMVGADRVWQVLKDSQGRVVNGKGVNVAVIDSGVDYRHADLGKSGAGQTYNSRVVGGYDLVNNDQDPMDDNGHGTHVAGIIGSNGSVKGVAPGANIYAYKVIGSGRGGNIDDIQDAIEAAIGTHFDGDPANDIHVINLSLGAYCGNEYYKDCSPDAPLSQTVDNASNEGIAVIVAAGNSGSNPGAIYMPGTARSAITVGSIDKNKKISEFSSRGPVIWNGDEIKKPDVVAPGEGYPSTDISDPKAGICAAKFSGTVNSVNCIDSTHRSIKGTSMAAPVVAGLAALVKQKNPGSNAYDIKYVLTQGVTSLGFGENEQGKGLVDANKIFDLKTSPTKTLIVTAYQDSYIDSDKKSTNYGDSARMRVDGNPKKISYMKFDLGQLTGKRIISARIKINIPTNEGSGSDNKFNLRKLGASSWIEGKVNYNNRPTLGTTVASFNGKGAGNVLDIDLKSFVASNIGNKVSLALTTDGSNDLILMTREATATRPRIVIEYQ
jgi:subtilisin family serine protease